MEGSKQLEVFLHSLSLFWETTGENYNAFQLNCGWMFTVPLLFDKVSEA